MRQRNLCMQLIKVDNDIIKCLFEHVQRFIVAVALAVLLLCMRQRNLCMQLIKVVNDIIKCLFEHVQRFNVAVALAVLTS